MKIGQLIDSVYANECQLAIRPKPTPIQLMMRWVISILLLPLWLGLTVVLYLFPVFLLVYFCGFFIGLAKLVEWLVGGITADELKESMRDGLKMLAGPIVYGFMMPYRFIKTGILSFAQMP